MPDQRAPDARVIRVTTGPNWRDLAAYALVILMGSYSFVYFLVTTFGVPALGFISSAMVFTEPFRDVLKYLVDWILGKLGLSFRFDVKSIQFYISVGLAINTGIIAFSSYYVAINKDWLSWNTVEWFSVQLMLFVFWAPILILCSISQAVLSLIRLLYGYAMRLLSRAYLLRKRTPVPIDRDRETTIIVRETVIVESIEKYVNLKVARFRDVVRLFYNWNLYSSVITNILQSLTVSAVGGTGALWVSGVSPMRIFGLVFG